MLALGITLDCLSILLNQEKQKLLESPLPIDEETLQTTQQVYDIISLITTIGSTISLKISLSTLNNEFHFIPSSRLGESAYHLITLSPIILKLAQVVLENRFSKESHDKINSALLILESASCVTSAIARDILIDYCTFDSFQSESSSSPYPINTKIFTKIVSGVLNLASLVNAALNLSMAPESYFHNNRIKNKTIESQNKTIESQKKTIEEQNLIIRNIPQAFYRTIETLYSSPREFNLYERFPYFHQAERQSMGLQGGSPLRQELLDSISNVFNSFHFSALIKPQVFANP